MNITLVLTLIFGFDIRYAIGASIVLVIATSSGAAIAYIKDKIINVRIGMFLEIGTTLGAITENVEMHPLAEKIRFKWRIL